MLYKNVFKFLVNQSVETIARSDNGRLLGAAMANAQSPSEEYMLGTASLLISANLSPAWVCVAADGVISSIR